MGKWPAGAIVQNQAPAGHLPTAGEVMEVKDQKLKQLRDHARRVVGKRLVVEGGRVVTAYHARRTKKRWLLRHAEQRAMKGAGYGQHAGGY